MSVTETANTLLANGLSVIPVSMPGKRPTIDSWDPYKDHLPKIGELQFNGAIAIICGKVSGNLECFDIDIKHDTLYEPSNSSSKNLIARLEEAMGDLFDELYALEMTIQQTISGGYHFIYRCETIQGNLKLARNAEGEVMLETRGEGGYFVAHPTPGYSLINGSMEHIVQISPQQRQRLFDAAKSLNEHWPKVSPPPSKKNTQPLSGLPSWEDFDQKNYIPDILTAHGWTYIKSNSKQQFWKRPGNSDSLWSGSFRPELNLFYVYSSSVPALQAEKAYTPSALVTHLDYGGDFEVSAREFFRLGYGNHENGQKTALSRIQELQKPSIPEQDVLRMTLKYQKKNLTPALLLNGTNLINFGEIFTIVGLPGQGKTAICEAIICSHLGLDSFGFTFNNNGKKALLIDTERHPDDVSDSHHNISKRLKTPKLDLDGEIASLIHLSLADFSKVDELKAILERELSTDAYSLVVIDGIVDFSASMNDDKDATEVVKWIRMLAVKHNLALVTTIHPNKGSESIAGHLGAFLYRWARAILYVRTCKADKSIKELTGEPEMAKLSHGSLTDLAPVYYAWSPEVQLLMPCAYEPQQDRGKADKIESALKIVFEGDKRYRFSELVDALMKMGHPKSTSTRWIKIATEKGILNNNSAVYSHSQS